MCKQLKSCNPVIPCFQNDGQVFCCHRLAWATDVTQGALSACPGCSTKGQLKLPSVLKSSVVLSQSTREGSVQNTCVPESNRSYPDGGVWKIQHQCLVCQCFVSVSCLSVFQNQIVVIVMWGIQRQCLVFM